MLGGPGSRRVGRSSGPPGERAAAARNRRAILQAAEDLFRHHEPDQVPSDQVAVAAGVSKATVFHWFASDRYPQVRGDPPERVRSHDVAPQSRFACS
ncbi:MAG TPA: helix-turn-helix domain-containing protein [Streptosporangiaceae bacterium]|jgi:hypothetical protein